MEYLYCNLIVAFRTDDEDKMFCTIDDMNLFAPQLGIDLGTTYTLVFVPGKGVVINEPSIVAVSPYSGEVLAVGDEAYNMLGKTPGDLKVLKPLKNGVIADYRVTEAMLSYFIDRALPSWSLFRPDVVVSVPVGVTSMERSAVVEAAHKAGARNAYVVKEPILAAIGAGINIQDAQGRMIVDIGGGTTDAAVISLGGIVASQSVKCAGTRIDYAITEYLKNNHGILIGERTAETVKINIGSAISLDEPLVEEVKGQDMVTGLPKSIKLTSNDIAKAIRPEVLEMTSAIKKVLQDTPPELSSDIIDNGIIMSGGTSLLRNLSNFVESEIGVPTRVSHNSLYCVINGTASILEHLDFYKKRLLSK